MKNSSFSKQYKNSAALEYTWGKYRTYAVTSQKLKAELSNWRYRVLILGIIGAIFGTLCQELIRMENVWLWINEYHFKEILILFSRF